jgi:hypothetical protein
MSRSRGPERTNRRARLPGRRTARTSLGRQLAMRMLLLGLILLAFMAFLYSGVAPWFAQWFVQNFYHPGN